ncbi:MAG: hypothetical protein J1G05_00380 [Clostridiales bacterium]|nr:hypothetical protein [Clostridiales bacterium]
MIKDINEITKNAAKGMVFGTQRCRTVLDRLGSPDLKLEIVHIAGTNGKGSVAEYMTGILVAAGRHTGTFTSPAVFSYNEQFRIDGEPLGDIKLKSYMEQAVKAAEGTGATSFEIETAAALYAFYCEGCEFAVVECGLGGTYDATNAILRKKLALISTVALEHTEHLGKNIKSICEHKFGIVKDCEVVVSALQPDEAKEFFKSKNAPFADDKICILNSGLDGTEFSYGGNKYKLSCVGSYAQPYNAALAIEGARRLKIAESAIYMGVNHAKPRGRIEVKLVRGRTYLLDGAHNPDSFKPLSAFLKSGATDSDRVIIFGCLADKDIDGNLALLQGLAKCIIAVQCESDRALSLEKVHAACQKYFASALKADSVEEALNMASEIANTAVVCGSFTLLKEADKWIEREL